MQTENPTPELIENAVEPRKPWQTPGVEVMLVDQTENDPALDFFRSVLRHNGS
jgi:hypothetical protein